MISPYIPLIFMGEEYAEENPFLFFISHNDETLIESVRAGRRAEFSAFHQPGTSPDPQSVETFESSKLNWDLLGVKKHRSMFKYYKRLIDFRKRSKVLSKLDKDGIHAEALKTQQVLIVKRWNVEETIFCILNFSAQSQLISEFIPLEASLIFNSQDIEIQSFEQHSASFKNITIPSQTLFIFSQNHV